MADSFQRIKFPKYGLENRRILHKVDAKILVAVAVICVVVVAGLVSFVPLYNNRHEATVPNTTATFSDESRLALFNNGTQTAYFNLTINNWTIADSRGIAYYIRNNMTSLYPGEPDYEKAWRLVRDLRTYNYPISKKLWARNAEILLDSIGQGVCEDSATALVCIWNAMGYNTRAWTLNHAHMVSEVEVNGHWELYDAGNGPSCVYYYMSDGVTVAGVEDLSANTSLVRHPVNPILPLSDWAYSSNVTALYDNSTGQVNGGPLTNIGPEVPQEFVVPPNVTMIISKPIVVMSIPAGNSCELVEPLVIANITGDGTVIANGQSYSNIADAGNNRTVFEHDLKFTRVDSQINVTYFLNHFVITPIFNATLVGQHVDTLIQVNSRANGGAAPRMPDRDPPVTGPFATVGQIWSLRFTENPYEINDCPIDLNHEIIKYGEILS